MINLERLKQLAQAATPGPWSNVREVLGEELPLAVASICSNDGNMIIYDEGGHSIADASYIAAVDPQTVLTLIKLIETQTNNLHELNKQANALLQALDHLKKENAMERRALLDRIDSMSQTMIRQTGIIQQLKENHANKGSNDV